MTLHANLMPINVMQIGKSDWYHLGWEGEKNCMDCSLDMLFGYNGYSMIKNLF